MCLILVDIDGVFLFPDTKLLSQHMRNNQLYAHWLCTRNTAQTSTPLFVHVVLFLNKLNCLTVNFLPWLNLIRLSHTVHLVRPIWILLLVCVFVATFQVENPVLKCLRCVDVNNFMWQRSEGRPSVYFHQFLHKIPP